MWQCKKSWFRYHISTHIGMNFTHKKTQKTNTKHTKQSVIGSLIKLRSSNASVENKSGKSGSTVELGWNHVEPGPLGVSRQWVASPGGFRRNSKRNSRIFYCVCMFTGWWLRPTPLKNMSSSVSWDDFPFPIYGKSLKHVPNHLTSN